MKRFGVIGLMLATVMVLAQSGALVRKPKVGDTAKYKLEMNLSIFGDSASYTSTVTYKVTEATDEKYSVQMSQTDYKVQLFGDEGAVRDEDLEKPVFTYSPKGDVLGIKSDLMTDAVFRMAEMQAIHLPGKEVKKGDTWSVEIPENLKTGVVKSKADYKYEDDAKIGQRDALVASFTYAEQAGTTPASSIGKVWIDKTDGSALKIETTWTNAPIPGAPSPTSGSYLLERID